MPACPIGQVVSVTVPTAVPSICAVIELPENVSAMVCHVLVPSAGRVPLASVVRVAEVLLRWIDQAPVLLTLR